MPVTAVNASPNSASSACAAALNACRMPAFIENSAAASIETSSTPAGTKAVTASHAGALTNRAAITLSMICAPIPSGPPTANGSNEIDIFVPTFHRLKTKNGLFRYAKVIMLSTQQRCLWIEGWSSVFMDICERRD